MTVCYDIRYTITPVSVSISHTTVTVELLEYYMLFFLPFTVIECRLYSHCQYAVVASKSMAIVVDP